MGKLRILFSTVIILAALAVPVLQTGCKGKLEPGGAYNPTTTNATGVVTSNPDKPFMAIESAFALAYGALDAAFSFERDNRAMLWGISHSIKQTMDKIRPQAVAGRNAYFQARALYVASATPQNLALLKAQLDKIQKFSTEATAALPKL